MVALKFQVPTRSSAYNECPCSRLQICRNCSLFPGDPGALNPFDPLSELLVPFFGRPPTYV